MSSWEIVSRVRWGAMTPVKRSSLKHPITYITSIDLPKYKICTTMDECVKEMQRIQKDDMYDDEENDIKPNFLVGDDGKVYEGRGWFAMPPPHKISHFTGQFLMIAHIGGNPDVEPSADFLESKQKLIELGMKKRYINPYNAII